MEKKFGGANELVCGAKARGAGRPITPSSVSNTPCGDAGGADNVIITNAVKIMPAARHAANFRWRVVTERSPDAGAFATRLLWFENKGAV